MHGQSVQNHPYYLPTPGSAQAAYQAPPFQSPHQLVGAAGPQHALPTPQAHGFVVDRRCDTRVSNLHLDTDKPTFENWVGRITKPESIELRQGNATLWFSSNDIAREQIPLLHEKKCGAQTVDAGPEI